jgi:hypothetical protein
MFNTDQIGLPEVTSQETVIDLNCIVETAIDDTGLPKECFADQLNFIQSQLNSDKNYFLIKLLLKEEFIEAFRLLNKEGLICAINVLTSFLSNPTDFLLIGIGQIIKKEDALKWAQQYRPIIKLDDLSGIVDNSGNITDPLLSFKLKIKPHSSTTVTVFNSSFIESCFGCRPAKYSQFTLVGTNLTGSGVSAYVREKNFSLSESSLGKTIKDFFINTCTGHIDTQSSKLSKMEIKQIELQKQSLGRFITNIINAMFLDFLVDVSKKQQTLLWINPKKTK